MTLRIIAGEKRGMTLKAPKGDETRPTLGRVRESLFMMLMDRLPGAAVADLYAGSGALGLEALSRGARHARFVETARPALDALNANIAKAGWTDRAAVHAVNVTTWLRARVPPGTEPFDLILLDPPYARGLCEPVLRQLAAHAEHWLAPGGLIVVQAEREVTLAPEYGPLRRERERLYSETLIAFYARPG